MLPTSKAISKRAGRPMLDDWRRDPSLVQMQKKNGFSDQEMNKVLYHRNRLSTPYRDKNGDMVTIKATGITVPDGKYAGKFVSVPGYVGRDGRGRVVDDPKRLWSIWKNDINEGRWPTYNSAKQLNKRDAYMHRVVMDRDARKAGR